MMVFEENSKWPKWWNRWQNSLAVDTARITSYAEARGPWGLYRARIGSHVWQDEHSEIVLVWNPWTGKREPLDPNQSQIWNARSFYREVFVDEKSRGWAWSWREPGADWKRTIILGYKLNGRIATTTRWRHSDAASAAGTSGPNYGQATGDTFGPA